MNKCALKVLLLLICKIGLAQDYTTCNIYQFANNSSHKKHIALVQKFNKKGQIISEKYANYKRNSAEGHVDGIYNYYYTDTLLTMVIFIHADKDTMKTLNYYDNSNRLIKTERYKCTKQLKKMLIRDSADPAGVLYLRRITEDFRTWSKTGEINITYDKNSRKVKRDDQNDYDKEWKYDEENRVTEEIAYSGRRLAFRKGFIYFKDGYSYTTIYYDENGEPEKPEYSEFIFSPIYTTTVYTDSKNRIYKEEVTTEKQKKLSSELSYYDNKDRLIKTVFFEVNHKKKMTHIYEYK